MMNTIVRIILGIYLLLLVIVFTYVPRSMNIDRGLYQGNVFVKYSFIWNEEGPLRIDFDRLIIEICILTVLLGLVLLAFWKNERLTNWVMRKVPNLQSEKKKLPPLTIQMVIDLQEQYSQIENHAQKEGKDVETFLKEKGVSEDAIASYKRVLNFKP